MLRVFKRMLFEQPDELELVAPEQEAGGIKEDVYIEGLDFIAAIDAHRQWKKRLADVIEGSFSGALDPAVICQDDLCVLGKWIYGTGKAHCGHMQIFHELKAEHAKFHINAAAVLQLAQSGKLSEASANLLDGEFSKSSRKVQTLLSKVYLELKSKK